MHSHGLLGFPKAHSTAIAVLLHQQLKGFSVFHGNVVQPHHPWKQWRNRIHGINFLKIKWKWTPVI
jgi:hypothetical protein